MPKNSVVGFPRIGEKRELKFALEAYWKGKSEFQDVEKTARELREKHWKTQQEKGIELISCNDFSYYDTILDTIVLLGAIPKRFEGIQDETDQYFAMARGNKEGVAMAMSKWFNTNYHYIIPELKKDQTFRLNTKKITHEYQEAKALGITPKINLVGPVTFLALSSGLENSDPFTLFPTLLKTYEALVNELSQLDDEVIVQFEEPHFVKDKSSQHLLLLKEAYSKLSVVQSNVKIIVSTYFEHSNEATNVLVDTPIWGLGLDFVYGPKSQEVLETISKSGKVLFAGVVDGRNIWKNDIQSTVSLLETIASKVDKNNIVVSSSCSLLHTPYSLDHEEKLDAEIKNWLSFSHEKLDEINVIAKSFFNESLTQKEQAYLSNNQAAIQSRKTSKRIHNDTVKNRVNGIDSWNRKTDVKTRLKIQKEALQYPDLATTTIGSFPQTDELRVKRREFKRGEISQEVYDDYLKSYIDEAVKIQEEIGLDVLVHGEPERNDMVEYFGELLNGFAFSANGWVQSYGARCVKPPILYGDVSLDAPMTTSWITYAQSKTDKIMKGMLTGPVTIINWSFVRDDIPRSDIAYQIGLSLSDEIDDLQNNGIKIIQVDEAAFKEGYPLREENIKPYETWAINSFKLATRSAHDQTQIHTHMCYSEFNDIIESIEDMDADVITIETAKSGNRLLRIFDEVGYSKEIGPGVYDIHSPRVPTQEEMEKQIELCLDVLPKEQLWINPDCGLKTRKWDEVVPSLKQMVQATKKFR